jgi:hypothetical protein
MIYEKISDFFCLPLAACRFPLGDWRASPELAAFAFAYFDYRFGWGC